MTPQEIYSKTTRHFLAPVLAILDDPSVTEVLINGHQTIYFERAGQLELADGVAFPSAGALKAAARNIAEFAGRPLHEGQHNIDARLPDGSRVHILLPPASRVGVCISIRKFSPNTLSLEKLIELDSLTDEAAEFLRLAVCAHCNLLVSGGTGSGKTSLLNALSAQVDERERIVVIEDSSELQLHQPHTLYLEAQPPKPDGSGQVTIRDLFVESLRMRPDRIVVGEVRRGEALDLIQSMISGHSGSMATIHASTPTDAATRLETLCLMSGVDFPIHVARTQVAAALQLVVQTNRFPDGGRRISHISQCLGLDPHGQYLLEDLYSLHSQRTAEGTTLRRLKPTGKRPYFAAQVDELGIRDRIHLTRELFHESL